MSVTHRHGQHEAHTHTDDEYALHQQPILNEVIVDARVVVEMIRANLGMATTREMLEELVARGEMLGRKDEFAVDMVRAARQGLDALPEHILAYRTADETKVAVSPERQAKREAGA